MAGKIAQQDDITLLTSNEHVPGALELSCGAALLPPPQFRGARVLVTGAGGFLGVNVAWALCAHGFAVRGMVRRPPSGPQWAGLHDVEWVQGDVCDAASLRRAMSGVESVIHTAASTRLTPRPRGEAVRVNVEGTGNVCEAAERAGVRRLVFTSTSATLTPGTAGAPADEQSPFSRHGRLSLYYTTKWRAEQVVRSFAGRRLETISLCPGYVIGPRDGRPTTNELILRAARTPLLILPPGGINFIDVREVALAHVRALWLGSPGERYVLAGPYATYWQAAAAVRRILGLPVRGLVLPRWLEVPLAGAMAIAAGIQPHSSNTFSVPSVRVGYMAFHISGRRADATFQLTHRPLSVTIADTLRWFRDSGLAPWLPKGTLTAAD